MKSNTDSNHHDTNRLFPVFIKLEQLDIALIGGGKVATEKLTTILNNAPLTSITIISKTFSPAIRKLAKGARVEMIRKKFEPSDLDGVQLVFSAVNDADTCKLISQAAYERNILHNAADKPALCDFYLGSIVQKGNLKIAISTGGKSPTMARRLKQVFDDALPEEFDQVLQNLAKIRASLKGDLRSKAKQLNHITSILVGTPNIANKKRKRT